MIDNFRKTSASRSLLAVALRYISDFKADLLWAPLINLVEWVLSPVAIWPLEERYNITAYGPYLYTLDFFFPAAAGRLEDSIVKTRR